MRLVELHRVTLMRAPGDSAQENVHTRRGRLGAIRRDRTIDLHDSCVQMNTIDRIQHLTGHETRPAHSHRRFSIHFVCSSPAGSRNVDVFLATGTYQRVNWNQSHRICAVAQFFGGFSHFRSFGNLCLQILGGRLLPGDFGLGIGQFIRRGRGGFRGIRTTSPRRRRTLARRPL